MRIRQIYRHEGTAAAHNGPGGALHSYWRDSGGPPISLTLTDRQFERLGKPEHLEVVIRASDGAPAPAAAAPNGRARRGLLRSR